MKKEESNKPKRENKENKETESKETTANIKWFKDRNFMINPVSFVFIFILTIIVFFAQIPKPEIFGQSYNRNDTLYILLFNSGDRPALLQNLSVISQLDNVLYHEDIKTDSPRIISPFIGLVTINISLSKNEKVKYIEYCYMWVKKKPKCDKIDPENIFTIGIAQPIRIETSVSVIVIRSNGTIEFIQ